MQENLLAEIYELLESEASLSFRDLVESKKAEMGITSTRQLSKLVGIEQPRLERMLAGDTLKVDLFSFVKLDEFLGIGIKKLVQVYVSSLKPEFIGELERTRKASYIIRTFDLHGLKSEGIINTTLDLVEVEARLTKFFGLDNILHYDRDVGSVLFSRSNAYSHDKMREFWVRSAIFQFEKIDNPNSYDREALETLVTKIRPYTRNEEKGFLTVVRALYSIGITVIVQKYLSKTQVRGGTFAVNGKPCIVITDYKNSYATIWFALMHELCHVLYDFDDLRKGMRFHLTGDEQSDLLLMREDDANYFAREMLFPQEKLDYIRPLINTAGMVESYAAQNKVHPSIIYAFYCFDAGHEKYAMYQQYFGKADKALLHVRTHPWDKETIFQEIPKIKQTLQTS